MLSSIKQWVLSVLITACVVNMVVMILPKSKLKPYVNLVINFIFVFIIITPVINFFKDDTSFENMTLKYLDEYNKNYSESADKLANQVGIKNFKNGYEESLKEVIKLKLDEYGYDIEDLDIDGSTINNLKIKSKNSNNNENVDIKSIEKESSKEVFQSNYDLNNDKSNQNDKLNQEENLKKDLVNILDVSVDNIKID
ncbi:MAG: stage III sporulation protein AF [Clostridioides sp.]|nr:stage III sporulation protein AF [Clostridioides sp.]